MRDGSVPERRRDVSAPADTASRDDRACRAVATLYHAWFTGLVLMVASRKGADAVGLWVERTFRRQHEAKFLASFEKLGLTGLPPAIACARYHYLSNRIGGVEVEYMPETDRKAWVRFPHPRWLYDGTALCAVPESVSHGFLRGWYARNGPSLGNPRLGFVCTSQDMTAQYGFSGYFVEEDRPLDEAERLRFRQDEEPPRFDPDRAPRLDPAVWTPLRLTKANRSYAMDYVANGVTELLGQLGAEGLALARLAARLIGRQFLRGVEATLGEVGDGAGGFAGLLEAMAAGEGSRATSTHGCDGATVTWPRVRFLRDVATDPDDAFQVWAGLWEGCLSTHDRFLVIEATRVANGAVLRVAPR
jgi:hypothetical protein